jgi:molybdopterin adenylyltransferase
MSYTHHQKSSEEVIARCAIVTLSDTRTELTDASGHRIRELLEREHHQVAAYHLIPDDPQRLGALLDDLLGRAEVDAVITTGGTGVSKRDHTITVVRERMEVVLPGFGELFRMLSWDQIGSGAFLSRALAGVTRNGKAVFTLPGTIKAVELAMAKLILPEIRHLLHELRK